MQLIRINQEIQVLGRNTAMKIFLARAKEEARNLTVERRNQERNRSGVSKWFGILWKRRNMSLDKEQIIG